MSSKDDWTAVPIVSAWLDEITRRQEAGQISVDTGANYRNHFLQLIRWLAADPAKPGIEEQLQDEEGAQIALYLAGLSAKSSAATLRTHRCSLRQAFTWLHPKWTRFGPEAIVISKTLKLAFVEDWLKQIRATEAVREQRRSQMTEYIEFAAHDYELTKNQSAEDNAYRKICSLAEADALAAAFEDETAISDQVLYTRTGLILLAGKQLVGEFTTHLRAQAASKQTLFDEYVSMLAEFYRWGKKRKLSRIGAEQVHELIAEAWAKT